MIDISVVVPTCNRRDRLLSLLGDLQRSTLRPLEVLVVDSSDSPLPPGDLAPFGDRIRYFESTRAVCIQRNTGIREAKGSWIFLCDDDIEVPADYLTRLAAHLAAHPEAGAVSGLVLEQQQTGRWVSQFPVTSWTGLLWRRVFKLGIWGEIRCRGTFGDLLSAHYRSLGNHISSAGWPVITDFSEPFFRTPVYALGAALIRRDWLIRSPFDERLDRRGYGDNYGVAIGFPAEGIHVVTTASVRHHKEQTERPPPAIAYSKRVLALDLFITSRGELAAGSRSWLLWSLVGNTLFHAGTGNPEMSWASLKTLSLVLARRNPYLAKGN
jgi:glycosyltransferase involved in cell wall biosynthesis